MIPTGPVTGFFSVVLGVVGGLIGKGASAVAGDFITIVAGWVLGSLAHVIEWASTLWINTPTPAIADQAGNAVGTTAWVQAEMLPVTGAVAVASILVGAARIAIAERPGAEGRRLAQFLVTFTLISAAGVGVASLLVLACDQFAGYIIQQATSGAEDFGTRLAQGLGLATTAVGGASAGQGFLMGLAAAGSSALIAVLVGLIALFASAIEFCLMLLRGGILVLLAGVLPLAAASGSEKWLRRVGGWIVALALYKPAAALCYAVAFQLGASTDFAGVLSGLGMLIVSLLALPFLLRLVMPAADNFSWHRGAASTAGSMVGAIPTGAMALSAVTGGGPAAAGGAMQSISTRLTKAEGKTEASGAAAANANGNGKGSPASGAQNVAERAATPPTWSDEPSGGDER